MTNTQEIKLQPFQMHKNLYFIGNEDVSVHLIVTEEGLILIDTGFPEMHDLILNNIKSLGYDPKNICAIFHSHGHLDHFANTQDYAKLSGAKTYISRIDNDILNGKRDLSWAKEMGLKPLPFFDCDVLLEDGDTFTFGSTTIRCIHTPGHTEGVMSFIITLDDNGDKCVVAMHGGIGLNSMTAEYLTQNGLPLDLREKFKEGLKRLALEDVDLLIGNHPEQTRTLKKMVKVLNGETDLRNKADWPEFLAWNKARVDKLLKSEEEEKAKTDAGIAGV
ncbi:MAG: MBL fold metallo-hydrolase [Clostridia bacterium]|nr:MBL fold metallo-hydrolase [Clostridia bacterium]